MKAKLQKRYAKNYVTKTKRARWECKNNSHQSWREQTRSFDSRQKEGKTH